MRAATALRTALTPDLTNIVVSGCSKAERGGFEVGLSAVVRSRDDSGLEWMKSLELESVEFLPDLLAVLAVRAAHDRNGTCRSPTAWTIRTIRILASANSAIS